MDKRHTYPKDTSQSYIVEMQLSPNNIIDYIEPCCGDCEYEEVDFSHASDIISAFIKQCNAIKLNNPRMEILEIYINEASDIDFSSCISLKELTIGCGKNIRKLDLTKCRQLERLDIRYDSPALTMISLNNKTPLQYIDVTGCHLHPSCLDAIHRIIERNGGEIVGGFEE